MNALERRIPYLPTRIEGLSRLATNLWWSWSPEARQLFARVDPRLWHHTRHNPLLLLQQVDPARLAACASDSAFLQRYDAVMASFQEHLASGNTWLTRNAPKSPTAPSPTSAPSSGSTTRCRSTPVASACSPATT